MKAYIIQPPYSHDLSLSDECFDFKISALDQCDTEADIILLPEYSDVPCVTHNLEETLFYHNRYIDTLLSKCIETAKRCHAMVFVNALSLEDGGYRNTTYVYDRKGDLAGKYFKKHLPPLEKDVLKLDGDYTFDTDEPYILELEGLRFAFLTCYDFYFYEAFPRIARMKPDIIIGCSLQRSDSHDTIETFCRFLAYNTNAYVLRSSVSFGAESKVCGASMVVSPKGEVLANMKSETGITKVEFDPNDKFFKPAGFGGKPAAHYEYMEWGRKPWQYRVGGPSVVPFEEDMKYPRICAHRGFNTIAPENSLPAFGAAVAMGAEEIEFDIWSTADGVLVSCHDDTLNRVSDGDGKIYDHTYDELLQLDFGEKYGEKFRGMKIAKFEDILKKLAGQVIMNIHVKIWDCNFADDKMEEMVALIRKYDCQRHVYFMTTNDRMIAKVQEYAPDIKCCVGWDGNQDPLSMVHRAIKLGTKKIQLFKPYFNQQTVDLAHENGIRCNVFWADDPNEAEEYLKMGIDTILTNDYNLVSQIIK